MKIIAALGCLLLAVVSIAQTNDSIVTSKTADHIQVPGTTMFLLVPADFQLSSEFPGFASENRNAQIRVEENRNTSLEQRLLFLEKSLRAGGIKIVESKDLVFNGYKARYISTEAGQMIGAGILIFGDEHFYIQVGGTYPLSDKIAANNIRTAAMMSVCEKENP
jgi:hypothetical protein